MGISLKPLGEVADKWGGPREGGSEGPPRSRLCLGSAEPGVAETSAGHLERLGSEDSLWLSPRCRFGDVLAPWRLFVRGPATELLAIADPLDPVVLHEDHLHSASRKRVRPENRYRRLGLGSPSQSDCHATSIISLGCGLSVDYLWVDALVATRRN